MIEINKQAAVDFNAASSKKVLEEIKKQASMGITTFYVRDIRVINSYHCVTGPLEEEGIEICNRGCQSVGKIDGIDYFNITFRLKS